MKDSFGRRWKPADGLAASSANRRESNGWNPLVRSRKFNIHRKMRIHSRPPDGLRTPDAFGPNGLMAYIERDEMDVQTVRVVRLIALEPQG